MMNKLRKIPTFLLHLSLLLAACQPTLVAEFSDRPVVECYLYSDEPVRLKISTLIPYRDGVQFSGENIDQLAITVRDETLGSACLLAPQGDGVYASDSDFIPQPEHLYALHFSYDGEDVTAETQLAALPQNVAFSSSSITVPSFGGGGFGGGGGMTGITISWSNSERDYYVLTTRCFNPDSVLLIDSGVVRTTADALLQDSLTMLSPMQFSYFGRHEIRLCRVQPEYAALLTRSEQSRSSQTLTEVNANVAGGFGIFTGVSCVRKEILVSK
ncbi:MAG: DUF4249 domain-containing protein [Prevotellaceae bacterium]|jgi:hypothetical protein|nr:DUF4249 domain-containing protein [Prevotellaceae bacterium]